MPLTYTPGCTDYWQPVKAKSLRSKMKAAGLPITASAC